MNGCVWNGMEWDGSCVWDGMGMEWTVSLRCGPRMKMHCGQTAAYQLAVLAKRLPQDSSLDPRSFTLLARTYFKNHLNISVTSLVGLFLHTAQLIFDTFTPAHHFR